MRKILFLIDSLKAIGGAEQMFIDQANYFVGKNIEVHAASVLDGRSNYFNRDLSSAVHFSQFNFKSFYDIREYFKLAAYLRQNDIKIVYSFLDFSNIIARALKIFRPSARIILVEPGSPLRRSRPVRYFEWPMNFLVYKILALSADVRDKLVSYLSAHRKKIVAIRNGVYPMLSDLEVLEKINRVSSDDFNILHISNMKTENKGHVGMIRSIGEVRRLRPEIPLKFWLLGDGPMRPDLEKIVEREGLGEAVIFYGAVPHVAVKDYCLKANVFLFNSRTEGGAQVIMEAESAALPVITSDFNSVREVVVSGQNGFIVARDDIKKFAARIIELYDNPKLWRQMAQNSRRFYESRLSFQFWSERFFDEIFN